MEGLRVGRWGLKEDENEESWRARRSPTMMTRPRRPPTSQPVAVGRRLRRSEVCFWRLALP